MRKICWAKGKPCSECGGTVNTNLYIDDGIVVVYHEKCLPAGEPGTVEISVQRGGSGKWVATKGGVRLGSGHVPKRVQDWEPVVIQQLERQAEGDPDPGHTLGGGYLRVIRVAASVVDVLSG